MPSEEFEKSAARADLCRLLAACYYQPGRELAEEKVFDSMLDAATKVDGDLAARARRLGAQFSEEGLEALLLDYTRLFLGPTNVIAQPYESVWLTGETTLMQDSTMAILGLYKEGGFEIDEEFRELPDHVAAELEFLYLLIFRELQARQIGDADALRKMTGLRRRLLEEHLGIWIGPFAAAVRAGARSDFYRELAELTGRIVTMERGAGGSTQH
jgi:TorA maturation chaperone TorD